MNVVITGGAGFIGSNLVNALLDRDYDVTVIDNLSTGKLDNIRNLLENNKNLNLIQGDIRDLSLLQKIFNNKDYVFHLAAISSVAKSVENPILVDEVNIRGTLNILVAARDTSIKKVVFASSAAVYGDTRELPKREDMPPNPLSPYAVSKLTGEYYCRVFSELYDLKTISLRYFNVYGARQDPNSEYAAVIPKFIHRILDNKPPIIYGDGSQTRDFIYVKDIVRANLLAIEKKDITGVFNIASGRKTSINTLANMIMDILDRKLKPIYEKPREGDIKDSYADISKAKNKLGFKPLYTLEDGLGGTIEYFKTSSS